MNIKKIILFLFAVGIYFNSVAGTVTKNDAFSYAQTWLDNNSFNTSTVSVSDYREINENNIIVAYLFNISPMGFIIVSSESISNPIIAFSVENNFVEQNSAEENTALGIVSQLSANGIKFSKTDNSVLFNRETNEVIFENGPIIQSLWGQVNCTNNYGSIVNVSNYYTPSNYAPGCVAVSMATLIHHYTWPVFGTGTHTYTDNYGSSRGTYTADFENTSYGWDNMLTRYKNKASTDYQREAEGLLVYQVAVSLNMDFEYNGSTSNVNRIPVAGDNHFRFSSVHRYEYSSVFWQMLDSNMFQEIPVALSVSGNGYGHSVVCDGIRIESDSTMYYHLNMGWWGSSNGWYRIRDGFNAGGYSAITGGVFNFVPIPALSDIVVNHNDEAAVLTWQYSPVCEADAFEVQQKVDGGSWETISDDIHDTTLEVSIVPSSNYLYRIRAKYKNNWSFSSWSNEQQLGYLKINNNKSMENIKVAPNPVNDIFNIIIPSNISAFNIDVFNTFGAKIYSTQIKNNNGNIAIFSSNWNTGLYFVKISNNESNRVISVIKN